MAQQTITGYAQRQAKYIDHLESLFSEGLTPVQFCRRLNGVNTSRVIPSIRKTGSYGVPFAFLHEFTRRKDEYTHRASNRGTALQACRKEKEALDAEEARLWRTWQPELMLGGDHA